MKTKFIFLIFVAICSYSFASAQYSRYIIELRDKAGSTHSLSNPSTYLTQKAINKRLQYSIAIDSTDLPITQRYIDSIRLSGAVSIINVSKWLNQVAIQTTDAAALAKINGFPFVKTAAPVATRNTNTGTSKQFEQIQDNIISDDETPAIELANIYSYGQSYGQVHIHQGEFLHNHGFSGQGMNVAVLDAGFPNHPTLTAFDSVRINNQYIDTWDFVTNNSNVNGYNGHGTHCLSIMAANLPGAFIGTAPKASFNLYRTEDVASEFLIEEQNLAAALERADSLGIEVSTISLGYTTFDRSSDNHTYANMNGNTTIAARAADYAAHKGMLVTVAMGNDGTSAWKFLATPADADSVMAVGSVNVNGITAANSSYGPSSDGQIKPSVAAMGVNATVVNASSGAVASGSGTSYATPNMAGLATCLWQAFPESNNMGIISALQESATQFTTPDDRKGYGIPDMKKAFVILLKRFYQQEIKQAGCNTLIKWTAKSSGNMNFVVERKLPTDADFIALQTINGAGTFANDTFNFSDNLSAFATPINISYRIKMNIDTDTSFYFTPVVINHANTCNTYTFIGDGNWNTAANWAGGIIPPTNLPAGSTIIIDPVIAGECILNTTQQIQAAGYFEVKAGKKLTVLGNLIIE